MQTTISEREEIVNRLFDRIVELKKVKPSEDLGSNYRFVMDELNKIATGEPKDRELLYDISLPF